MSKIKFSIFAISLFFLLSNFASASSIEFNTKKISAQIGDVISVPIYINATEKIASIVFLDMTFNNNILWAKSFDLGPNWLSINDKEYTSIDNKWGILKTTAGFEGGFSNRILFGTAQFIATTFGSSSIRINDDSFILDTNNKNILDKKDDDLIVKIDQKKEKAVVSELFDIKLGLEKNKLFPTDELVAKVVFESFGVVPTPVNMIFLIADNSGKIISSSKENTIVETEAIFTKKFENLNLLPGNYTLKLKTLYNTNIEDNFSVPFSIHNQIHPWWIAGGIIGFVFVVFILIFFIQKHRKMTVKKI